METVTRPARDASLDHYKFWLIACVVFGHLIEPALALGAVKSVYNFIYLFHIPAFVFVSGLFTRPGKIWPRIAHLGLLLVVFQVLYFFFLPLIGDRMSDLLQPYWVLWYLLSLIFWTLLAPFFIRFKLALYVAVLLALAAGSIESMGYDFSAARTFYFLPFFVAGLCHGKEIVAFMQGRRRWGLGGMALCAVAALAVSTHLNEEFLYGSFSYANLGQGDVEGAATRLALLCVSFIGVISLIPLMPHRASRLSAMGRATLAIFILHGFIVLPLKPYLVSIFYENVAMGYALAALLCAAIVWGLSQPVFTKLLMAPGKWFERNGAAGED